MDKTVDTDPARSLDKRCYAIVKSVRESIPAAMADTPLRTTAEVMLSLTARMRLLKAGILESIDCGNDYCTNVLYRVYIEHMLRANAVFLLSLDNQPGAFALDYKRLAIEEEYAFLKAYESAGLDMPEPPRPALERLYPEAADMTDKDIRSLASPFQYKNLIKAIIKSVPLAEPNFITKIIPAYSRLSGFIHGGPTADRTMKELENPSSRRREMSEIAHLTVAMLCSAERWLLILAEHRDSSCAEALTHLNQMLDDPTSEGVAET